MNGKPSSLKPSVCIDAVLGELSPPEAIEVVAQSGIRAVEFWGWWDKDVAAIQSACERHSLAVSACCTRFISLVDPAQREAYLAGLAESIAVARQLGCPTLISQVGDARSGMSRPEQHQSLVDGLKAAAKMLESSGVTLVIEPLNDAIDHPGYYLVRSDDAFQIIDEVDSRQVKVVFDFYHQQISEGHVITRAVENLDKIGHFHAAGNPGRHELTRGELDYRQIFAALSEAGYNGYVGLEYWPLDDALAGLREIANWFTR